MKLSKIFKEGIFTNNPVLIQMVGLCSTLAISSSFANSIGMGISVIFVLTCSNIVISLLRNFIPNEIRIPAFIVVIASFVTIVQMVLEAYVPALYDSLGIFIPLIVVNCIILARAEGFAYSNGVIPSIVDGLGQGLGYTLTIGILGFVREIFGTGSILGMTLIPEEYTIGFMTQPASSFILLGVMLAIVSVIGNRKKEKEIN
ncbi:MAG: electron transport complex subunit E [Peptoniphilaceae bacterium]|nr:electron transport complex subunit E [Peptoniphilaceae bacterium]MDD7383329.1 electron transport complex subunit E [Peptoniphilaceae bacterium]MDY3738300.1 electron transport complex subunit E [Peptoniphilaceae bacterium]